MTQEGEGGARADLARSTRCRLAPYGPVLVDHVATVRLVHWDADVRALAAQALGAVAWSLPAAVATTALDRSVRDAIRVPV
jgi:hypothetical protein